MSLRSSNDFPSFGPWSEWGQLVISTLKALEQTLKDISAETGDFASEMATLNHNLVDLIKRVESLEGKAKETKDAATEYKLTKAKLLGFLLAAAVFGGAGAVGLPELLTQLAKIFSP